MPKHISFNPADFEPVKKIALGFPGAEEAVSHYDTPSIKINGKFMCRLVEGGDFIPIHLNFDLREHYLEQYPEIFHNTFLSELGTINRYEIAGADIYLKRKNEILLILRAK